MEQILLKKASCIYNGAKSRARKKNLDFNITKNWIIRRLKTKCCEITGVRFSFDIDKNATTNFFAPSIDRINPKKGYTKDNCRIVIWGLNRAKGDNDEACLFIMCEKYYKKMKGIYDKQSNRLSKQKKNKSNRVPNGNQDLRRNVKKRGSKNSRPTNLYRR